MSTRTPRIFSSKLLFSWVALSMSWCVKFFFPRCRTLHFSLLNSMSFLSAHFSSISKPNWMGAWYFGILATPPNSVSSANLMRVHSVPTSKLLMRMLKSHLLWKGLFLTCSSKLRLFSNFQTICLYIKNTPFGNCIDFKGTLFFEKKISVI